jgi:deoxyribonuclease-4
MKLIIHSPYSLNFARIPVINHKTSWWIKYLINEMHYASKMGAIGCVIHMGKQLELTKKMAIENMFESLTYVINNTPKNVKLILETSSGQGTELLYNLKDLKYFYDMFSIKLKKRIKICIDTCHVFVAGYNLSKPNNVKQFFKFINKLFNIKNIILIQFNDAVYHYGSKMDRHAPIGKGKIGINGLSIFAKLAYKYNIPIVLETPSKNYKKEILLIKKILNIL